MFRFRTRTTDQEGSSTFRHRFRPWRLTAAIAVLALAGTATGLVIASSSQPASASVFVDDRATTGNAPTNNCQVTYYPEMQYPYDGYRLKASCSQFADFTKARGVSTYPYTPHNETEWFTQVGKTFTSAWKIKMPIVHPHDMVEMEYAASGSGINLYTGSGRMTFGQSATVEVTMPQDASGTIGLYYYASHGQPATITTAPVAGGVTRVTIPAGALPAGQHQVFASFFGSGQYPGMRTANIAYTVAPAATKVQLTSNPNNIPLGQSPALTADVGAGATGEVTFVDRNTLGSDSVVGTAPVVNGKAILTKFNRAIPLGDRAFQASYSGDANHSAAWSNEITLRFFQVGLSVANPTPGPNDTLNATATLPVEATGNVQFRLVFPNGNMTMFPSVPLVNGKAEFSLPVAKIGSGSFKLVAHYFGGGAYPAATSAGVDVVTG